MKNPLLEIVMKFPFREMIFKCQVRGDHKIKHFAYDRDFFVHEIPRIKHTQNALYPGMKYFQ